MTEKQLDRTFLIVDDDPLMLRAVKIILAGMGHHHVLLAEDVDQALSCIGNASAEIDVVLTDLNMPGRDGIDLLRDFSEYGYRGDIILFSGEDRETIETAERLAHARGLSILGTLAKPVRYEALGLLLQCQPNKQGMRQMDPPRLVTATELETAIQQKAVVPWFQPKVAISNRTVVGVELLARWPDSPSGPVFPDQFIPVAEEYGLIDALTFSLLEQAAMAARSWRQQGINLKVAFNVSMKSLKDIGFAERIECLLADLGEDLAHYQMEVTESTLAEDPSDPLDVLLRLRMKRLSLSIDDFGTGHSSLTQLRDLPFDELKLDKSFVQSALGNRKSMAILESSINVARKLEMRTVAEGIETRDEWALVKSLGCDQVQGYFIAKPMPASDIPGWIKAWPNTQSLLPKIRMQPPGLPDDETSRLQALKALEILDTDVEERFDRLTRLAQRVFDMPVVLITLVDANRQWFKSCIGLDATETSRDISFCGHAILGDEVFVVQDARQDDRFADNPLVSGPPHIRFYAGCPLVYSDGSTLGTLCLIDREPRELQKRDLAALKDVAKLVERELAVPRDTSLDELTGILHLQGFLTLADKALQQCYLSQKTATLLYFELDQFKSIRGRHGRAESERVLRKFAQLIGAIFGSSDAYGRVGVDEFAVLLSDADAQELEAKIGQVHRELDRYNTDPRTHSALTCSESIVRVDGSCQTDMRELLEQAAQRLYRQRNGLQ